MQCCSATWPSKYLLPSFLRCCSEIMACVYRCQYFIVVALPVARLQSTGQATDLLSWDFAVCFSNLPKKVSHRPCVFWNVTAGYYGNASTTVVSSNGQARACFFSPPFSTLHLEYVEVIQPQWQCDRCCSICWGWMSEWCCREDHTEL